MVAKRIRSEYMKRFKDPKWETYTKCYEEMLRYRLGRRLLEHTHNPWFWGGSDTDSSPGSRSPPQPSQNRAEEEEGEGEGEGGAELEECRGAGVDRLQETTRRSPVPLRKEEDKQEVVNASGRQSALRAGSQLEGDTEARPPDVERAGSSKQGEKDTAGARAEKSKPSKSSKQPWRSKRVRPAPSRQSVREEEEKDVGGRHPFALYASGEKHADIAGRKTHNVRPAASTKEIHEAALRAKNRREVERQIQAQRSERRRTKSADVDVDRQPLQPEFNPWLTEYMRCFSARSR